MLSEKEKSLDIVTDIKIIQVRRPSLTNLDGELIGGIEREVRDRHDHKLHRPEGNPT